MIRTWTPKTDYYIELPISKLQEILDAQLVNIMKYDETIEWTYEDACYGLKYLENGNVACNIQLRNSGHVAANAVLTWIDEEDFQLALYMYGVIEFLIREEYNNLIPLVIT